MSRSDGEGSRDRSWKAPLRRIRASKLGSSHASRASLCSPHANARGEPRSARKPSGLAVGGGVLDAPKCPGLYNTPRVSPGQKLPRHSEPAPQRWRENPHLPAASQWFAPCKIQVGQGEKWIATPAFGRARNDERWGSKAERGEHCIHPRQKIFRLASLAQDDKSGFGTMFFPSCEQQSRGASRTPPPTRRPRFLRFLLSPLRRVRAKKNSPTLPVRGESGLSASYRHTSSPFSTSTTSVSPAPTSPERMRRAMRVSTLLWR